MSQQERVWARSNVVVSKLSMAGFLDLVFPDGPFAPSLASTERKLVMDGLRSVHVKLLPRDIITGEIALSKMEGDDISFPVDREGSYYPTPLTNSILSIPAQHPITTSRVGAARPSTRDAS